MRFSRGASPLAAALAAALVAAFGATGCAHAPRARAPEPTRAPAPPQESRADAGEEPEPEREEPGRTAPRLDPSEEITAEELATIPEPVPRAAGSGQAAPGGTSSRAPSGATETVSGAKPAPGDSEAPEASSGAVEGAWSVQVYASESRSEAERVARAASTRLGVEASVGRDGTLFKVRLGRFASEADAQALRERAIAAGYPGAFRTRARP